MELHSYQKRAIDFAIAFKSTYMMIDLGLGKTAIALKAIEHAKLPALVMCPIKVGYNTWTSEIKLWTPQLSYVIFHGPKKDKKLSTKADIYILPYSSLKWFYTRCCEHKFKLRKFFVVFDESTMFKDPSTHRWKKYIRKMMPIYSQYRMCLSATPIPNGLVDLWTQYYVLDKGKSLGPNFTTYRNRFFHYTGPPRYQTWIKPGSKAQIYQLIKPITKRLDSKDYLKLPSITYNRIKIKPSSKLLMLYKKLKRDSMLEFDDVDATAFNEASKSNKLRQLVQGCLYTDDNKNKSYKVIHKLKAEVLKEIVEGLNGRPVIIPVQYRFDYDIICSVFNRTFPVIRGGVPEKQAMEIIKKWNQGKIPVLIVHPQSIGHGLNLQAGGHNIIWYAATWSLDQFKQLNGRLHRQGQKHGVVVNILMMDLPIEDAVYRVLKRRNATQRDLLDAIKGELK